VCLCARSAARMALGRGLYIGNLPSSATEEGIREVFGQAGAVESVRIITDAATGKPKGFAFVDYVEAASAATAMRTLQSATLGGQTLRLDWTSRVAPRGIESLRSQAAPEDALTAAVQGLTGEQIFELLLRIQKAANQAPAAASQLLEQNPAILFALLHALLLLGQHEPLLPVTSADARDAPAMADVLQRVLREANTPLTAAAPQVPLAGLLAARPGLGAAPHLALGAAGLLQQRLLQQISQMNPAQVEQLPPAMKAHVLQLLQAQRARG